MAEKVKDPNLENLVLVENALSKTEQFVEDNKKVLSIVVSVIVVVIGGYLAYKSLYLKPKQAEAQTQMFSAEQYFEKDSFRLAIKGDGNNLGFTDIVKEYGSTKSGNLARYYCGISYLRLKDYPKAIEYLEDFKSSDKFLGPIAIGSIGDANMELGKTKEAVAYFMKAADKVMNDFTTPIYLLKAGQAYEKLGQTEQALNIYERIERDFSKSQESRKAEKYIAKLKMKLGKI